MRVPRKSSTLLDLENHVDIESIYSTNKESKFSRAKSKEIFVVLATVLLLLVIALITLIVLYFNESGMRQSLINESERNIEILRACDRFEITDMEEAVSAKEVKISSVKEVSGANTCPPCKVCHSYKQIESVKQSKIQKGNNKLAELKNLVSGRVRRNARVEDGLQRLSKELLVLKYGKSSPITIELFIKIPSRVDIATVSYELFDVNDLPYSILHHLSQVSSGAWDGCAFTAHHTEKHMLIAEAEGHSCGWKSVHDTAGLEDSFIFSEYNSNGNSWVVGFNDIEGIDEGYKARTTSVRKKYPHNEPYCLSISTQIHSPNFYIVLDHSSSTVGETDLYANSQFNGLLHDNDVCIGKLTSESIDNLRLLSSLPLHTVADNAAVDQNDFKNYRLEKHATITRAKVKS